MKVNSIKFNLFKINGELYSPYCNYKSHPGYILRKRYNRKCKKINDGNLCKYLTYITTKK